MSMSMTSAQVESLICLGAGFSESGSGGVYALAKKIIHVLFRVKRALKFALHCCFC